MALKIENLKSSELGDPLLIPNWLLLRRDGTLSFVQRPSKSEIIRPSRRAKPITPTSASAMSRVAWHRRELCVLSSRDTDITRTRAMTGLLERLELDADC